MIDASSSIEACANHYGDQADAMRTYLISGQERALAIPNRGPLHFDSDGLRMRFVMLIPSTDFIFLKTS